MDGHQLLPEERFYELLAKHLAASIETAELTELDQLLHNHPDFRLKADLFTEMWKAQVANSPDTDISEAYIRHLLKFKSDFIDGEVPGKHDFNSTQRKSWLNRFALFIGGLMILTGIVSFYFYTKDIKSELPKVPAISSIVTRNGNKTKINLPDGSQVWLNAGSRLDYNITDFNQESREVELTGEAFFDITHNAAKPFIVRSGNMRIRVLGTSFNVKAYPGEDNMETSLIRGSVEITMKDKPGNVFVLKPNEKLVVAVNALQTKTEGSNYIKTLLKEGDGIIMLKKLDYEAAEKIVVETAWVDNKLVFHSEKFSSLALKMERWYGIRIKFKDQAKEDLMFTGIFTTETIQQALNAMREVHPFNYSMEEDIVLID